jgi:hypothetical protein
MIILIIYMKLLTISIDFNIQHVSIHIIAEVKAMGWE